MVVTKAERARFEAKAAAAKPFTEAELRALWAQLHDLSARCNLLAPVDSDVSAQWRSYRVAGSAFAVARDAIEVLQRGAQAVGVPDAPSARPAEPLVGAI